MEEGLFSLTIPHTTIDQTPIPFYFGVVDRVGFLWYKESGGDSV